MRALCWYGKRDLRVRNVPEPRILNPRDAIVKVSLAGVCGSDLHIYNGYMGYMEEGDILGHEFIGTVAEAGSKVTNLKPGDRVVVPFAIACGSCYYCQNQMWSLCDNSNPNSVLAEEVLGYPSAGLFGYSRLYGGYAGGQAEYVRVPFADVGPLKLPDSVSDEKALFLSDIFPTGYMAAENCNIRQGDTVAVWGCGPVGQFAVKSAYLLGAERVIAIDRFPERLQMAREHGRAEVINYEEAAAPVEEILKEMTGGRGPDACIDAVGMEAHGTGIEGAYESLKQAVNLEPGRAAAFREALESCRKGGVLSIPGVYGGLMDKVPLGAGFSKGLTLRMGQTHVHRYMRPLLERIERGEIDPSFVITHRMSLDEGPRAYSIFNNKEENCVKVVLRP